MYISEYSDLGPKERRQLAWKRRYKEDVPAWDDSMVLLTKPWLRPGEFFA